jgi:hypothetical protein
MGDTLHHWIEDHENPLLKIGSQNTSWYWCSQPLQHWTEYHTKHLAFHNTKAAAPLDRLPHKTPCGPNHNSRCTFNFFTEQTAPLELQRHWTYNAVGTATPMEIQSRRNYRENGTTTPLELQRQWHYNPAMHIEPKKTREQRTRIWHGTERKISARHTGLKSVSRAANGVAPGQYLACLGAWATNPGANAQCTLSHSKAPFSAFAQTLTSRAHAAFFWEKQNRLNDIHVGGPYMCQHAPQRKVRITVDDTNRETLACGSSTRKWRPVTSIGTSVMW